MCKFVGLPSALWVGKNQYESFYQLYEYQTPFRVFRAALNTFIPISFMREYWSVMGNNDSVKLATNNPGCVFQRPNDYKSPWTLVQPKD